MNITLITTILRNSPQVILPTVCHCDILLFIKVWFYLLQHLLLKHIHEYLLNITQKIKHREIHNYFKHERLFNNPINSQQFTLLFLSKVLFWIIYIKAYLLFQKLILN